MAPFPFRDALGAREHFPRSLPIQFPVFPLTTGCRLNDSCFSQDYSVSGGHQGPPWLQNITSADSLLHGSSRVNRPLGQPFPQAPPRGHLCRRTGSREFVPCYSFLSCPFPCVASDFTTEALSKRPVRSKGAIDTT